MALNFITGAASSGKTELVQSQIAQAVKNGGNENLIYIVPEQFTLQSELELIKKTGSGALIKAQVLSFNRLAYRVFSEVGFCKQKNVGIISKNMLIRKITGRLESELKFYGKSATKQGFTNHVSLLISELYRSGTTPEDLTEASQRPNIKDSLHIKLTDIALIFEHYSQFLKDGCISQDDTPDYLAAVIDESSYIKNSRIWIDGFFGFTKQELKIIEKLLKIAKDVTIALTSDENRLFYANLNIHDFFYETKQTVNALVKTASSVGESVFLSRKKAVTQLEYLADNYFKEDGVKCREAFEQRLFITPYGNIYEETEAAARAIIYLVRDLGLRYRDISLVCGEFGKYRKVINGTFIKYGIPVFIDGRADILSHPVTEFARALPAVLARDWPLVTVLRLVKTGLLFNNSEFTQNDLYDFENYCIEYGITGKKWHFSELKAGFADGRYNKERINAVKDYIKTVTAPFTKGVRKETKLAVTDYCERMYAVFDNINLQESLRQKAEEAQKAGDNIAYLKHKQIWGVLLFVFEEMSLILGKEVMTPGEFADILDAGLATADMGLIPPSCDHVQIGDLERTRLPQIKALLVLGLNENCMNIEAGGILLDDEREYLRGEGVELSKDKIERTVGQGLYIYSLFSKPSEYLLISYPTGQINGKALYPHPAIDKFKSMFKNTEKDFLPEDFISTERAMLSKAGAITAMQNRGEKVTNTHLAVLEYYKNSARYAPVMERMARLVKGENVCETLSGDVLAKLYANGIVASASRLEGYIRCPFAHFVKYNLKARERKVYKVDSMDVGTLFHAVLENFHKLLDAKGLTTKMLTSEQTAEYAKRAIDITIESGAYDKLSDTASNKRILEHACATAEKSIWALCEHIKMGDFVPYGMEVMFEAKPITKIVLEGAENKRFEIKGRIDRVDIMDFNGKRYVKIIDYKTGALKYNHTDIYYGTQLQLMMYLDYYIKSTGAQPESLPGGVFYFNINNPKFNAEDVDEAITEDGVMLDALNKKVLSEFKMSGLLAADLDVARGVENNITGWSQVVGNVRVSEKTENGFADNSNVVDYEEFDILRLFVNEKMKNTAREIMSGKIDKRPCKNEKGDACAFCAYASVCNFELVNETARYRQFKKIGSVNELLSLCKEELRNTGRQA